MQRCVQLKSSECVLTLRAEARISYRALASSIRSRKSPARGRADCMHYIFPQDSKGELIVDGCIHVSGVTASIIAALSLVLVASNHLPPKATASVIIYSSGLLAVFGFSAAYNLVNVSRWKGLLRRFDHAAIYVKIAATNTPFAVVKMGGTAGFALLGVVWAIAALGATAK